MKKFVLMFGLLRSVSLMAELHNETITIRVNSDIETIDLSQQPPETRKILHKLAYKQYLQHNQWACFKAALVASAISTAAGLVAVWYVNK